MSSINKMRALNRLPFDFVDGLKIRGVDVTNIEGLSTPLGAGLVGFTPVGGVSATNVQAAIAELDAEKARLDELSAPDGSSKITFTADLVSAPSISTQTKLRESISVKDAGAIGNGIVNDKELLESVINQKKEGYVPSGTYLSQNTFNIRLDGTFLHGSGANSAFKSSTVNYPILSVGSDVSGPPIKNIIIKDVVIVDQPAGTGGGGSDNNEAAIKVMQGHNVRVLNTDFLRNYLGLRFGRENQTNLPSKDCLGFGNYFLNAQLLPQEFMGVDACKHIAFSIRTENGSATGQHGVRFAGQSTNCIASAGTVIAEASGGIVTGASIQSGSGHVISGMIVENAVQGLQVLGTANSFTVSQFISRKSQAYGARIQEVSGAIIDSLILKDSLGEALYVVAANGNTPSHLHIHCQSNGSVSTTGADHVRIEGSHHDFNLVARGMVGGLNGINLIGTTSFCRGKLWSEAITAGDGGARDMRIDGSNHTLNIVCNSGTFSGTGHILDIQQTSGSVVIGASYSIIKIKASGSVTVSGNNNTIIVNGVDISLSGSNNVISGTTTGTITDTGVGNDLAGLNRGKRAVICTRTSTGATPLLLKSGNSDSIVIPDNTAMAFEGRCVARRADIAGECAMYTFKGIIRRDTGAASTTLLFSNVVADYETVPGWDFTISANTTQGGLQLVATGAAATINWKATVNLTEVQ